MMHQNVFVSEEPRVELLAQLQPDVRLRVSEVPLPEAS